MNEAQWRAEVIQLARYGGWACYYTHYSPFSTPGWPDLALIKPPRVVLAELKTARGKLRPEQADTAHLLERCEHAEYYLWRPADLEAVSLTLDLRQGRLI